MLGCRERVENVLYISMLLLMRILAAIPSYNCRYPIVSLEFSTAIMYSAVSLSTQ